jgi:hypothetical protein
MIAEGIKYLADMARKAAAPVKLDVADPRNAYYVLGDGQLKIVTVPPAPRNHRVGSLSDLVGLVNRFAAEGLHRPAVWYDGDRVVAVLDDAEAGDPQDKPFASRIELATLPLVPSDIFRAVVTLDERRPPLDVRPSAPPRSTRPGCTTSSAG